MKKIFPIFLSLLWLVSARAQMPAPGRWYMHCSPSPVFRLEQREALMYGISPKGMYVADTRDRTRYKFDKTRGLSDVGITAGCYSAQYDCFVLGYENGRIDLVYGDDVVAIDGIYEKEFGSGKRLNDVCVQGRYAYFAADFGVLVVDLTKEEIKETCQTINGEGVYEKVSRMAVHRNNIYITVGGCVKYAPINASSLNDYSTWKTDTCFNASETFTYLEPLWNRLLLFDGERLYWGDEENSWRELELKPEGNRIWDFVAASGNRLVTGMRDTVEKKTVIEVRNGDMQCEKRIVREFSFTTAAVDNEGNLWIATQGRLYKVNSEEESRDEKYIFWGPASDNPAVLTYTGHNMVSCMEVFNFNTVSPNGHHRMEFSKSYRGYWDPVEISTPEEGFYSASYVLEDPEVNDRYYAGSALSGLVVLEPNGSFKLYNEKNSPLELNNGDRSDIRISALDLDAAGNLWVLETMSDHSLFSLDKNGVWQAYDIRGCGYNTDRISNLLVDYWQHKWVLFDHSRVAVFETDGSGNIKSLQVDMNYGNDLATTRVYCMVEDDLGYMWFGTDRGVKLIDQHAQMFDNPRGNATSVAVKTVKVPRDGYLMELLKDDQVMAIAVDGANRKWLGTASNGVFLVSADGMEELEHFTAENSALVSNNIKCIKVDDASGVVYIACEGGLVAYRGSATRTTDFNKKEVLVYPNPVRPEYGGNINIKGLPNGAVVKITDTHGNLIYQGRATGGGFTWNGLSQRGKKPAAGVLLVFAAAEGKGERAVAKIFFAR